VAARQFVNGGGENNRDICMYIPSDQKENELRVQPHRLFYRKTIINYSIAVITF
jgi:hypothetical protein